MFDDMVRAFGAEPVTVNSSDIYAALKSGTVDAQENPLAYMDLFKHYEVMKYVSMTNHMWSGFNMLAHQGTWNRIPADIRTVIERQVPRAVRLQRQDQQTANDTSRKALAGHGLAFNEVDTAPFRAQLSGVYAHGRRRSAPSAGRCSKPKPAASPRANVQRRRCRSNVPVKKSVERTL